MSTAVSQSTISKRSHLSPQTYTMSEVAGLCGIAYTSIWTQVREGTFPVHPIKFGRTYRFPKRAVDRLLDIEQDAEAPE